MLKRSWCLRFGESEYPAALMACPDAPRILYGTGLHPNNARAWAIVGSRAASRIGCERARAVATILARAGITVVSGGAMGIDTAAHRGALEAGGETVAVLGGPLDNLYPLRNRTLFTEIADRGSLLTPFAPGQPLQRWNFPKRNRIIAGLAEAVVVVEASARSGSLSTARAANEYARQVFAFPESPGTHQLLAQGAKVLHSPEDLLALGNGRAPVDSTPAPEYSATRDLLLNALTITPRSLEDIAAGISLPAGRTAAALLMLELKGAALRTSHGYVRVTS